jgi:hypothetical protein
MDGPQSERFGSSCKPGEGTEGGVMEATSRIGLELSVSREVVGQTEARRRKRV